MTFKPPIAPNTAVDRAHVYDESTALPVRDGLKFVGAGVTATDDSNNDATIVTIPGASIASGGEPYTTVDSLSGTPRSVTDWGPLINTAVTNGAKRFLFGAFDYPFSTKINVDTTVGVTFEGTGGALHPARNNPAPSSLLWKGGSGSGIAIQGSGSDGFTIRDMGVYYDVNAYDGDLLFFGLNLTQTGTTVIDCCQIGLHDRAAADSGLGQAHSLLNVQNWVGGRLHRTSLRGAKYLVYGATTATGFGAGIDDNKFFENTFESATLAYFCNIGTFWKIHYNTFYGGAFGDYATPQIIAYDATGTNSSVFSLSYNEFWDFEPPITQSVNNPWIARISNNDFWSPTFPAMVFNGPAQMLVVENNYFNGTQLLSGGNAAIDLGSSATAFKNYARVKGNYVGSSASGPTWPDPVANTSGHGYLEIDNPTGTNISVSEIIQTVGRERVRDTDSLAGTTTVAASSGVVLSDLRLIGNDSGGIIQIGFNGPGPSAGAIVDITFARAIPRGFSGNPGWSGAQEVPAVQLTPIQIGTNDIAVAQDVKAYPKLPVGPSNTGWTLAFRTAPGVGATVTYAYRVVQT